LKNINEIRVIGNIADAWSDGALVPAAANGSEDLPG
jgi:hypothetical protein